MRDKHLQSQLHVQGGICCADSMRKETAWLSFLNLISDFTEVNWKWNDWKQQMSNFSAEHATTAASVLHILVI